MWGWLYQHKYLKRDEFDNYFITKKFRKIDAEYAEKDEELLPLGWIESNKYVPPFTPVLTQGKI